MRALCLAFLLLAAPAVAQDRTRTVAGWTVADVGGKPGDDSERSITISRTLSRVELSYALGENGGGASYVLKFSACNGFNFSTGFQYDDPPATHLQNATAEIADSYADFAPECKEKYESRAVLMQGFAEALATAEKWLAERPFVYPPDESPSSDEPGAPDTSRTPGHSI